jgi:hypothetical protein
MARLLLLNAFPFHRALLFWTDYIFIACLWTFNSRLHFCRIPPLLSDYRLFYLTRLVCVRVISFLAHLVFFVLPDYFLTYLYSRFFYLVAFWLLRCFRSLRHFYRTSESLFRIWFLFYIGLLLLSRYFCRLHRHFLSIKCRFYQIIWSLSSFFYLFIHRTLTSTFPNYCKHFFHLLFVALSFNLCSQTINLGHAVSFSCHVHMSCHVRVLWTKAWSWLLIKYFGIVCILITHCHTAQPIV